MYSIKAIYRKRMTMKSIKYKYDTDSYDEAMELFEKDLQKKGILEENIVSYIVAKTIVCGNCGRKVNLVGTTNRCDCGKIYDSFGNEDVESRKS